jgi:hypothetical protein
MSKAEWSGWVQAIGSILAILAGAIFVWLQLKASFALQAEAERKVAKQRIFNMLDPIRRIQQQCDLVLAYIEKGSILPHGHLNELLSAARKDLELAPVYGYPNGSIVLALNELHSEFDEIDILMLEYLNTGYSPSISQKAASRRAVWQDVIRKCHDALTEELRILTTAKEMAENFARSKNRPLPTPD